MKKPKIRYEEARLDVAYLPAKDLIATSNPVSGGTDNVGDDDWSKTTYSVGGFWSKET